MSSHCSQCDRAAVIGSCHGRRSMRWCHFGAGLRSGRVQGERHRGLSWRRLDGALRSATSVRAGNSANPLRRERRDDSEHVHPLAADSAQEGCSPKYPRFCAAADNHTGKSAERRNVRAPGGGATVVEPTRDRRSGTGGRPNRRRIDTPAGQVTNSAYVYSRIPAPCTCWGCPRSSEPQAHRRRAARARRRQCGALASSLAQAPKQRCSVAPRLSSPRSAGGPALRPGCRALPAEARGSNRTAHATWAEKGSPAAHVSRLRPHRPSSRALSCSDLIKCTCRRPCEIVPFSPTADSDLFLDMAKKNLSVCAEVPRCRPLGGCMLRRGYRTRPHSYTSQVCNSPQRTRSRRG